MKFAREFDRLTKGTPNALTREFLRIFSKDRNKLVRMCFAEAIKVSAYLPLDVAERLAKDVIDVATPILRHCPVLTEAVICDVIAAMPEPYTLALADRQPLSPSNRGCHDRAKRAPSAWSLGFSTIMRPNCRIRRLQDFTTGARQIRISRPGCGRRPDLPFDFVNKHVTELADRVHWRSLGERRMTKYEAWQLQDRFQRKTGQGYGLNGHQIQRMQHELREAFEKGLLDPLDTPRLSARS